ncbi:hypothetical protein FHX42_005336 [Saccharopolyspora lacisalsi]|uniref:Phage head morphogenesis domain-containing protein n=1 Tax=Halosaccharopolyspora lacisalsi TaxID=1000566 RepID=A0A839E506_9PSEU|nr:hypothetical protein [Halosaccharopolyspora lacisalsi]
METANVATLDGARQQQDTAGEPMFKGWMATTDQRVRPAHWHADKQAVPLDEPFTVGGYPMQYPGDTSAPPALWKNCRCTVLVLNSEEAAESNERRDRELPNRTDVHGNPVAADAAPGGDDPMSIPTQPDSTSMSRSERIANSATEHPPAARFTDPQLTGPTKVRVTDDGWVYGHIGAWGTAHAGRPDVSIDRFRDDSLARFHRHPVVADSGERIKTGPLATGGHAATEEPLPTISAVQSHYDDPRFVVADVTAGTDDHGIWISGSVRPGVTPFQVMLLDRYSISGDWRENELLAACSVSVPGFHLDDDHGVVALSASAAHDGQSTLADPTPRAVWAEGGALVACVAAGIIGTTDDAGCAECGTTTASAGDTSPTVDTTALGWEIYRASQHAAAVDHEVTAAARAALAPSLENVIARAELGSDDLDNLTDDDMRAVRRIARLPHRAGKTSSRTTTVAANWVDQEGGLPSYIDRIVKHLKSSMSESHAIATAVNAAKKMCRSGDTNWPGKQDVNAGSRAEACASVREWEAMKRRANAD